MIELIFATHNSHKVQEVQQMLSCCRIQSLSDINYHDEIIEDGNTFRENAEIKVDAIRQVTKMNIFADDSGLVIPGLDNAPGIYSSRYAGTGKSEDNIQKVLLELKGSKDRFAYFKTVICLLLNNKKHFFEGIVEGTILEEVEGKDGFGYDPIFCPQGYDTSFASLSATEKNQISHRGKAIAAMQSYINKQF